jgi:hypothetical protein
MKNKFNCDWLSINSRSDMNKVKVKLMDNGDWEYDRMGIGMNKGRVFIIDLDDSGEDWREMLYCDKVKSVEEVIKIGIECGVIEKIDWGYDENDMYRYEWEFEKKDEEKFNDMIGMIKGCGDLYSFIGKK